MKLYRISKSIYSDDLSGAGAGLFGGRWNPKGLNMLYTAGSISLATLEYLAHNIHLLNTSEICLSIIELPESASIREWKISDLPEHWNSRLNLRQCQEMGAQFLQEKKAYAMKVPSVIVPQEFNFLLNPNHPEHQKTKIIDKIAPFKIDERLFRLG